MSTLNEQYVATHGEPGAGVGRHLFRACLHRRALMLAPLIAFCDSDYFAPDRELLERAAQVRSLRELDEEIADFRNDARNQTWWRKYGRVRVSTRRLRRLARRLLPKVKGAA